jgi:hypothetical protein
MACGVGGIISEAAVWSRDQSVGCEMEYGVRPMDEPSRPPMRPDVPPPGSKPLDDDAPSVGPSVDSGAENKSFSDGGCAHNDPAVSSNAASAISLIRSIAMPQRLDPENVKTEQSLTLSSAERLWFVESRIDFWPIENAVGGWLGFQRLESMFWFRSWHDGDGYSFIQVNASGFFSPDRTTRLARRLQNTMGGRSTPRWCEPDRDTIC